MLEKIILFASPILSAATIASVIAVNSWKKKKAPKINITWEDDDDDDYSGGPGEGPYLSLIHI